MTTVVPIIIFLAGQLGVAIWWASRVSAQLEGLRDDSRETRQEVGRLREEMQNHDTAIAVMRAVAKVTNGAKI